MLKWSIALVIVFDHSFELLLWSFGFSIALEYSLVNLSVKYRNINLFPSSVAFHIENIHLICTANQMTNFYMKYNAGRYGLIRYSYRTLLLKNTLTHFVPRVSFHALWKHQKNSGFSGVFRECIERDQWLEMG